MSFRKRGKAIASSADPYSNENTSDMEEPDPVLMERLGIFFGNSRQVKITTHMHPTLSHSNLIEQNKKKNSTTSPASTLSDKGIGSSVGSFDAEFKHEPPFLHPSRNPYNFNNKTGSLDSRTHDFSSSQKAMSVHTRSSSDIIGSNGRLAPDVSIESQSGSALWNSDPRRANLGDSDARSSSMTSLIRSRQSSIRRKKTQVEMPPVKDAEIKKLPQLFRLSPASTAPSSAMSSSHSLAPQVSINEAASTANKVLASSGIVSNDEALNDSSYNVKSACNVIIKAPTPPTPVDMAPPLPPKAFKLHKQVTRFPSTSIPKNVEGMDHLRLPHSRYCQHVETKEEKFEKSSLSFGRPRVFSDGALNRKLKETTSTLPNAKESLSPGSPRKFMQSEAPYGSSHEGSPWAHKRIHGGFENEFFDFTKNLFNRGSMKRSSTRSNPPERPGVSVPYRHHLPNLQPFSFELPHAVASEGVFVGREWLFSETLEVLNDPSTKGVLIIGKSGHGKTAISHHLASQSYQGWSVGKTRKEHDLVHRVNVAMSTSPIIRRRIIPHGGVSVHSSRTASPSLSAASSRTGSQVSLVEDSCRKLASQVIAFHFCQSDNNTTCYVPEFLHNIASQLSLAPQLAAYSEMLAADAELQKLLTFRNCIINPSLTLEKAIIEPLVELRKSQKLPKSNLIIMIDSIMEAEEHSADHGYSVLSFLDENLEKFPNFIKLVITCATDCTPPLPLHLISLDDPCSNIDKDMQLYISQRIAASDILSTFTLAGKSDPGVAQKQLSQHLMKLSAGNFLYLRLCLDLIDRGAIVLKSSGFRVLPVNLHEICLLLCNLNFNSYTIFNDLRDVIAVVSASLYPLKDEQIFHAVNCVVGPLQLTWEAFNENLAHVSDILFLNPTTARRSFFHSFFKRWFLGKTAAKDQGYAQGSNRFKIDVKRGHALLATVLSQQPTERLHKHATLELAIHLIESQMFKDPTSNSDLESMKQSAHLLSQCSLTITEALVSPRNLFYPKLKVLELLLRSGADPNASSSIFANAPPLSVAAHLGYFNLVDLLLAWGAEVNFLSTDGKCPITYAASTGYIDVVKLLLRYQPVISQADQHGYTPLLYSIKHGHSNVAKMLLSRDLYPTLDHHLVAAQQTLVAASTKENVELIHFLLEESDFDYNVNFLEPSHGESPLTSAAAYGKAGVCEILIKNYHASPHFRNRKGLLPLLCAVKHGQWDAADVLLNCGASMEDRDPDGKTPLIMAACHGHVGILQLLLSRGSDANLVDNERLTALSWAALRGHVQCVRSLIGYSDLNHCDVRGKRAIDLAVLVGNEQIVDLLLESGSDVRHTDITGMNVLDFAVENGNALVVSKLLRYGAEIHSSSWKLAKEKPEIISMFLQYFLEDGNEFYRNEDFITAIKVYAGALKRIGEPSSQKNAPSHNELVAEKCAHLLLSYSRSLRKLGNLDKAEIAVSRALQLKPHWFEALYARSRVRRENSRLDDALQDVIEAEQNAPSHSLKEIWRLKAKIKKELGMPESPVSFASDNDANRLQIQGEGLNFPGLSNNIQPYQVLTQASFYPMGRLIRENSQESLAESMVSLSLGPTKNLYFNDRPAATSKPNHQHLQSYFTKQLRHSDDKRNDVIMNGPIGSSDRSDAVKPETSSHENKKFYITEI